MVKYEWSPIWVVLCIIWTVMILIQLCHDWFFVRVELALMSDEQRAFRFTMIIEVVMATSTVISSVLFILICMMKTPVVTLSAGNVADLRRDFLHG